MANALQHGMSGTTDSANLRKALADVVTGTATVASGWSSGSNHKMTLYSGTIPANAAAALAGNVPLCTIPAITWNPATAAGVASILASTPDSNAANSGTATFFRLYRTAAADPGDVIIQGTVGTSASDLNINNTTINAGANVSLTSGTYTACA